MVAALQLSSPSLPPSNLNPKFNPIGTLATHQQSKIASSSRCRLFITNSQQKPHHLHDHIPTLLPPPNENVAAVIFGDGGSSDSSRLYPLTKRRSQAAIPIAANYRLIDVVVSNCINSSITKIYVLTQFNSTSLNSHLAKAYSRLGLGQGGFVEVVAAYQSLEHQAWFQGTADAIRRCSWVLEEHPVSEFLVLPGHHLYRMDYRNLLEAHRRGNADITIAALGCSSGRREEQEGLGRLEVNSRNQVVGFHDGRQGNSEVSCRGGVFENMGIYVINRDVLRKLVHESFPEAIDLGSEVIHGSIISLGLKVQACPFNGYWEDMRSISAFYQANMEFVKRSNNCQSFYDMVSPLYTIPRCLPPTTVTNALITDCVIGDGCILNRCRIKGSVVGMRTRIGDGVVVEDSVILGADNYQDDKIGVEERRKRSNGMNGITMEGGMNNNGRNGVPIGIGDGTLMRKAIVDKNARIGKNVKIINKNGVLEADREREGYMIRDGIIVIMRGAVIPDDTIL
ncbi:unnamed protein product [Linum trigynum]|uniref:Nucleotidyl transferase domain-containing protein n=1 Tax=Linum trigynum TaxID=586398 RepID=A0AAV2EK93_9ROSI